MTIIIVPTERCNYRCSYCFQPEDEHKQDTKKYDFDAIKQSLYEIWSGPYRGADVCLHGGECTLIPKQEFEKLCELIYNLPWPGGKVKGAVGLVTNGSMIDDEYIRIFKKWNVNVGISCDGPPELNLCRGPNPESVVATEQYNQRMKSLILKLRENGVNVSIMCILHKKNASTVEALRKLGGWMLWLKKLGIINGRVNPVYSDEHPELELSSNELYRVWYNVYTWNKKHGMRWNPVIEMEKNLKGESRNPQPCIHNRCDPYNTHTLSILPDGQIGNCDRTFKRGLYLRSLSKDSCGRYEALGQLDCKDCRYWRICGGGCPEEGIDGDWRRKTRFCEAIRKTYAMIEKDQHIDYAPEKEPTRFDGHQDATHGDAPHGDSTHGDAPHGDSYHGDLPHGDSSHGDTPDWR